MAFFGTVKTAPIGEFKTHTLKALSARPSLNKEDRLSTHVQI